MKTAIPGDLTGHEQRAGARVEVHASGAEPDPGDVGRACPAASRRAQRHPGEPGRRTLLVERLEDDQRPPLAVEREAAGQATRRRCAGSPPPARRRAPRPASSASRPRRTPRMRNIGTTSLPPSQPFNGLAQRRTRCCTHVPARSRAAQTQPVADLAHPGARIVRDGHVVEPGAARGVCERRAVAEPAAPRRGAQQGIAILSRAPSGRGRAGRRRPGAAAARHRARPRRRLHG